MADEPPSMSLTDRAIRTAWRAYRRGHWRTAATCARRAVDTESQSGPAWYALACALERGNRLIAADRAFARCARAATDPQDPPFRVTWECFERAVKAARKSLPRRMRKYLKEVSLVLEDYPAPEYWDEDDEPEILGVFLGPERGDLADPASSGPGPRIHLFRRPHEHATGTAEEFVQEVARTLFHEFAHYLGFDEAGMPGMDLD